MYTTVYMIDLDGRGLYYCGSTGPDWVRYWDATAVRFATREEAEAYRVANCWEPHTRVVPMESGKVG